MIDEYKYLFPFEKVPFGSRIMIYGAGVLGQEYLRQIMITGYCKVIGFLDKNYDNYPPMTIPIYSPYAISQQRFKFDYIIIALRAAFALPDVLNCLKEQGVEKEKIIYVLERAVQVSDILIGSHEKIPEYPTILSKPSFAFYLGGGFGDMIIQKRFVIELLRLVPTSQAVLYAVNNISFLDWLYSDCPQVRNVIPDLGARYARQQETYSLSLSIIATFLLKVDYIDPMDFSIDFTDRIRRLQQNCEKENLSIPLPNGIAYRRRIYNRENCYTWFNYGDTFSITDYRIPIPFDEKFSSTYSALNLNRYITLNIGNGTSQNGKLVAKSWPKERFVKVISLFRQRYPKIKIVQLGSKHDSMLENADYHVLGQDFGLIAYILRNSMFHLDIEGGLVHLATQIGTKCFVLFGPTPIAYFGYSSNVNITSGNCHNCYGLYADTSKCARHMDEPECMYSITPEIVMSEVHKYLSSIGES